jgi:hypothetical protein
MTACGAVKINHDYLFPESRTYSPYSLTCGNYESAEYGKLEKLYQKEKGSAKKVTKTYIDGIK